MTGHTPWSEIEHKHRRWAKSLSRDVVVDTLGVYQPISAIEVYREKRARSSAISVHPPGGGLTWPYDAWLTQFAMRRNMRRNIRCRPWKKAR